MKLMMKPMVFWRLLLESQYDVRLCLAQVTHVPVNAVRHGMLDERGARNGRPRPQKLRQQPGKKERMVQSKSAADWHCASVKAAISSVD